MRWTRFRERLLKEDESLAEQSDDEGWPNLRQLKRRKQTMNSTDDEGSETKH